MSDPHFEPASDKAIGELVKALQPVVESAEGELDLRAILDLPEAKQAIAAWGVKHEVAALGHGGKVAPWLVGALLRRGLSGRTD
jgi:hypothetical protein